MDFYELPEHPGAYAGLHPLAADVICPTGGFVALDAAGNANPGVSTVTGHVIGIAEAGVDNTDGAAAAKEVLVKRGIFACGLHTSNIPTKANVGMTVFAITPDTVATAGTCRAGILLGFREDGRAIVDTRRSHEITAADLV